MAKSATFGVLHLGTSFGVGYAISGSVAVAGAITLVEPAVNTVVHYFFDRWWHARHDASAMRGASVESPHAAPSSV
jgi:uncharacterized membrane protein